MKAFAASTPAMGATVLSADFAREPAAPNLVKRWRVCCAALFGFGAPPPGEVDEQTLFDTAIMPLLWPPY